MSVWMCVAEANKVEGTISLCLGVNEILFRHLNLTLLKVARLDFFKGYLPSLSINYVGMSKDMEKKLPQLYYIKMKISYDLGFIAIRVAMAT